MLVKAVRKYFLGTSETRGAKMMILEIDGVAGVEKRGVTLGEWRKERIGQAHFSTALSIRGG
jgi:hypothetical protein